MKAVKRSCAFTGHRPNKLPWRYDETASGCIALRSVLAEQIALLAEAGVTQFLSGMAEGVDTWAALSVLELREKNPAIKLHCILPCTSQAEKWSASSRDRYRSILELADSIVYVSRDSHKNCMLERNRFMVDASSLLICYFDGRPGGTAQTVHMAEQSGLEIINLAMHQLKLF